MKILILSQQECLRRIIHAQAAQYMHGMRVRVAMNTAGALTIPINNRIGYNNVNCGCVRERPSN